LRIHYGVKMKETTLLFHTTACHLLIDLISFVAGLTSEDTDSQLRKNQVDVQNHDKEWFHSPQTVANNSKVVH